MFVEMTAIFFGSHCSKRRN